MKNKILFTIYSVLALAVIIASRFVKITVFNDEIYDGYLNDVVCYAAAFPVFAVLIKRLGYRLFTGKRAGGAWLCFAVAMLVAVNNFPFIVFFKGEAEFACGDFMKITLFAVYCFSVAAFEELLFRGFVFNYAAERLITKRGGIIKAIIYSSLVFGAAHLLNLLSGAGFLPTLGQAGYTTLIGALCAFVLFKTRNLIFPLLVHGVYNFCGLCLTQNGLGGGFVLDTETIVLTAVAGAAVGAFVLTKLLKTREEEISDYAAACLNVGRE